MKNKGVVVTELMIKRSVVNEGDKSRLYSVIKRAAGGETITFSVIGGSITQGCLAQSRRDSYAELACGWWKDRFPWTVVNYINAGIGATDSYIGVHRADRDIISHSPDIVIVEFSVNDADTKINPDSYRSLVSNILTCHSNPAVILLFTLEKDGTNFQKYHELTGREFNLPMISYADAVFPEIQCGNIKWEDISPDDIHPSESGHRVIAELINSYMDTVYSEAFSCSDAPAVYKPVKTKYSDASMLDNRTAIQSVCTGFEKSSVSSQFPYSWSTVSDGRLEFEVTCLNAGIMYYRTASEKSGVYSVYVDGVYVCDLDGDFEGGWGDYTAYREVFSSETAENHRIKIVKSNASDYDRFTVIGLCLS